MIEFDLTSRSVAMTTELVDKVKSVGSFTLKLLEGWVWKDTASITSSWRLTNLFVAETTILVTASIIFVLYFWTLNRQAHLKSTKGSTITYKVADKAQYIDSDEDEDEQNGDATKKSTISRRRSSARQALLEYNTEQDDDEFDTDVETESPENKERKRRPSMQQQGLADIVDHIKLFSYLNKEALKICLNYVEVVDVSEGEYLFGRKKYDGSLLAVMSGEVKVYFHDYGLPKEDRMGQDGGSADEFGEVVDFTVGSGHVVTPLLSLLDALVMDQKRKDATLRSTSKSLLLSSGISAVATASGTRVIRIPPRCFSEVLEQFPQEVYRIAQTTVGRVQRIAVLTLVKTLGLRSELLLWDKKEAPIHEGTKLTKWKRIQSVLDERRKEVKVPGQNEKLLDELLRADAAAVAAVQLGCPKEDSKAHALLQEHAKIVNLAAGTMIINPSTRQEAVYLLLHGKVEVGLASQQDASSSASSGVDSSLSFQPFRTAKQGALIGTLMCFGNNESIFSAQCYDSGDESESCVLLRIPKHVFHEILSMYPKAMVRCLDLLFNTISPLVHLLNWNSEWDHVEASTSVAKRGSPCDAMFIVLSGRLRAKDRLRSDFPTRRFEEYGRGKCVGEIIGLTESSWPYDVFAVRQCELARVPIKTLVAMISRFPAAGLHFARVIASKVNGRRMKDQPFLVDSIPRSQLATPTGISTSLLPSYGLNLATVAVVSLSSDIDLSSFCSSLVSAFGHIAPTKLMTKALAREQLGEKIYRQRNSMHDLVMTRLLAELEENNRLVVYQADLNYTWWTKLCILQADCILLVVNADRAPEEKRVEKSLAWAFDSMDVRIELVVVGQGDQSTEEPEGDDYELDDDMNVSDKLNNWSEDREWINGHHLVRSPFSRHMLDFHRMCRRVAGISVGLVLGGGGARGLAHLGVIKALQEAGIIIDMVGGTSQGAFIAALYAKSPDNFETLLNASRKMSDKMASMKEKLLDLTLPMTSMFSGRRFNHAVRSVLGTIRIQDLVLNFFCVTTDIQKRELVVHSKGLLWKYVRASMSLTGYLPPVSEGGSLLVDGGYMNVLPADVMREQFRAKTVIAVDVSPEEERDYLDYGMHLSGWWLLWNSLNPFVHTVKVPSIGDISDSLRWVGSDHHRKKIKNATDLHLSPPIKEYGTLEYGKFDEIVEKGYVYAKPIVEDFVRRNPRLVSRNWSGSPLEEK